MRRAAIWSTHVRTYRGRPWLRLKLRGRAVDIALGSFDEEADWLRALGRDPASSVARYVMRRGLGTSRAERVRAPVVVVTVAVAMSAPFWAPDLHASAVYSVLTAVGALFFWTAMRSVERVAIGTDGVRVRRLIGLARFIAFQSIAEVLVGKNDVGIRLHDGRTVGWHRRRGSLQLTDELEGMAKRIERALVAHRALVERGAAGQLARGLRPVETWMREVRAMSAASGTQYREANIPLDAIWKTVESANVAPTARAGGAVALRDSLDDVGRGRLRAVAATCASDGLRRALEAAAGEADEDELATCLRAVRD